jgi:pyrimidine-nucleoside phosphorylase
LIPSRLIEKKRQGRELPPEEMEAFFQGFLAGQVPDYQMAAFLMAVQFQGMSPDELEVLLDLMIDSGEVLDLSDIPGPKVDKHSTGGVGDKTSLVVAPLAAELGLIVPMMSGRGLGHTAGTLDKLEAIPGFRTRMRLQEFRSILSRIGVAMLGQTEEVAPLDRRLYALRDATATVPSIPLIAASIMSKKLAEGLDGLILDVKTGAGAFLPDPEAGRELASAMTRLGEGRGVRTAALITGMDAPLGKAVGNGLETKEAFACLAGKGPTDLAELCSALVGEMLFLGGLAPCPTQGATRAREALAQGRAVERMSRLVEAQGGDPRVVENPELIPSAPERGVLLAAEAGFVREVSPVPLGYGVVELGGGRRTMDDPVDLRTGFVLGVRPGDRVERGDPMGEVHAADSSALDRGLQILRDSVRLTEEPPDPSPSLIRERIPALFLTDGPGAPERS